MALDGRSGAGKSTLARRLARELGGTILEGDDFFAGGVKLREDAPADRAATCIDWRLQREVLSTLRSGQAASYRAFDWERFDGTLRDAPCVVAPAPVIWLEGVYSARPELADLIDARVLLRTSEALRSSRLLAREGGIGPWERQWHEAEVWYFDHDAPESSFDLIIDDGGGATAPP